MMEIGGMSNIEIKPCPFCGKTARVRCETDFDDINYYRVTCLTSRCYGHNSRYYVSRFTSKETAIKAWNRKSENDNR